MSYVKGGVEVTIAMRGPCNYKCYYCVAAGGLRVPEAYPYDTTWLDIDWISEMYKEFSMTDGPGTFVLTSMECGRSEPTIHPQMREIMELATSYGVVSVPTNNSQRPRDWLPQNTGNVVIRAALHPQGERDLDGFVDRLLGGRDMGARVSVVFVAHPHRLDRVARYREKFAGLGVEFEIAPFSGIYRRKEYPASYGLQERAMIGFDEPTTSWYHRLHTAMENRDFIGIPCLAGYRAFFIGGNELFRCLYAWSTPIEEPLPGPMPCPAGADGGRKRTKPCACLLLLRDLNTHTARFWNRWRKIGGWSLLPEEPIDDNAEFQRRLETYHGLMGKYGKSTG